MRNRIGIVIFFIFLLIGAYLRFTFLEWGKPYYFHPDENNITTAIAGLSFNQWNPHFFAYGSIPIYCTYIISFFLSGIKQPSFAFIAYTLRFISALLSFLLIPSLLYIGTKMYSKKVGFFAALLASVGTGFIQFAHFGTFEMWLAFFSLWFFYASFLFWKNPSKKTFLFVSILAGILLGIKISTIPILFIPILLILLTCKKKKISFISLVILYIAIMLCLYVVTNPSIIFDTTAVVHSLQYESSVALGTTNVFYTESFLHTIPIIFQVLSIFPFLLNPLVFTVFLFSFFILLYKTTQSFSMEKILLLTFFLVIFLSQAYFFAKWTRYMVPCIPFMYLFVGIFLETFKRRGNIILSILLFVSLLYGCIFFLIVYPKDTRVIASAFVQKIAPVHEVAEPYDLGIMPFFSAVSQPTIINIYALDRDQSINTTLREALAKNSFFLSLSQRLISTRLKNSSDFPLGNAFYKNLSDKKIFRIVYKTPCNIWCKIIYNGDPINNVEETATVFDHPFVTIFQKI